LSSILLPYQRNWIADRAPVKVCEKSRRIGITWAEAADAALDAADRGGSDWWYIGYNKDMALEFIETASGWARRFDQAARAIEQIAIEDRDKDILAYRIRFASGHKVVALSSRPSNLRGKQGVAIIDEAAFHDDLDGLLKAALAFTMWGGRVHVISTHNGADNSFNRLVEDIRAGRRPYSLHRATLDDALGEGLYQAICRVRGVRWSADAEREWRAQLLAEYGSEADEELRCIPSASGGVFLPAALIEARMSSEVPVVRWDFRHSAIERGNAALTKDAEDWIASALDPVLRRIDPQLMSCFGEDFGRSGDLTVIWPLQIGQGLKRCTPFVAELRNVPFKQQAQVLFHIADRMPRLIGAAMDARGNGQYLAEEAALRYGSRVQQVMLSSEWYRDNMPRYKAAFEDGLIELPRDADILADHRMLRMEGGIARLPEQRLRGDDGHPRHGDSAIAGALAYHASYSNHQEYAYVPARTSERGGLDQGAREDESRGRAGWFADGRMRFRRGAW
ncbi:MAG TPA: terminase family protein, partial [Candidatus Binataceae bacterium]|nr:terminase family protein [Candidatus Binataceae bacterium]